MYTDPLSCALVVYRMSKIERLYKFVKVVVVKPLSHHNGLCNPTNQINSVKLFSPLQQRYSISYKKHQIGKEIKSFLAIKSVVHPFREEHVHTKTLETNKHMSRVKHVYLTLVAPLNPRWQRPWNLRSEQRCFHKLNLELFGEEIDVMALFSQFSRPFILNFRPVNTNTNSLRFMHVCHVYSRQVRYFPVNSRSCNLNKLNDRCCAARRWQWKTPWISTMFCDHRSSTNAEVINLIWI